MKISFTSVMNSISASLPERVKPSEKPQLRVTADASSIRLPNKFLLAEGRFIKFGPMIAKTESKDIKIAEEDNGTLARLLSLEPKEIRDIKNETHNIDGMEIHCHSYVKTIEKNGKDRTYEVCIKAKKNQEAYKYADSVEIYSLSKKNHEEKSLQIFRRFCEPKTTLLDLPRELQEMIVQEAYFKGANEETNLSLLASNVETRAVTSALLEKSIAAGRSPVAKFIQENKEAWATQKLSDKKIKQKVDDLKRADFFNSHGEIIKSAFGQRSYSLNNEALSALPPSGLNFIAKNLFLLSKCYTPESLIRLAKMPNEKKEFVIKNYSRFLIQNDYARGYAKNGDYVNWLASECDSPEKLTALLNNFPDTYSNSPFAAPATYKPYKTPFGQKGPIPPAPLVQSLG